jgi:FkbM family methyltransferase
VNIEDILKHVTKDGDTVLDVGGHVGNIAWFMTTCVGTDGKVFSFEPHPELFKALQAKAERYPNLAAFNFAISDSPSPVTLYFGMTEASNQASTICANLVTTDLLGDDIRTVDVPAVTLDQFCTDHGLRPSVIKIDVEGAEAFVLAGASAVLESKPLLIFEMGVTKKLPDHVAKLRSQGYQLYFVDIHRFVSEPPSWDHTESTETRALRNCIISFTDADAEEITPYLSNVLAVSPEKHAQRLARLRVVTVAEAMPHFADPKKLRSRHIKRLVRRIMIPSAIEDRFPGLVVSLRKIANLVL